jgi:small subunit ribosomal protein S1
MASDENPKESFASLFESEAPAPRRGRPEPARALAVGDRCRAEVVQVGRESVFVEVVEPLTGGRRQQAFLGIEDVRGPDGQVALKAGDVVEANVVAIDSSSGEVRLGWSMGRPSGVDALLQAHAAGVAVDGTVTGLNKGGLEVDMGGTRAFCPISHADRGYVAEPQALVGRTFPFVVTEVSEDGRRVVVSRRAALERQAAEAASHTLARLQAGAVVRGTVTAVRDFGAFVDLGGIEGLIPNAELSHERGARAQDLLAPGDAVEVGVREIREAEDRRGQPTVKITLSLKALAADPWDQVASVAPEGRVLEGTVTRVVDFGAFVRLAPGVEGLLHVSELGGKVAHPSTVLQVGQPMRVVVRSLDAAERRIALVPAPEGVELGAQARAPKLVVGAAVQGEVDRVEPYGVFLQVAGTRGRDGRGLIPNQELGTPRGADTRKLFPPGTRLTAKVLETGVGKLRLSIRALKDDQERADFEDYRASSGAAKLGTLGDLLKKR